MSWKSFLNNTHVFLNGLQQQQQSDYSSSHTQVTDPRIHSTFVFKVCADWKSGRKIFSRPLLLQIYPPNTSFLGYWGWFGFHWVYNK